MQNVLDTLKTYIDKVDLREKIRRDFGFTQIRNGLRGVIQWHERLIEIYTEVTTKVLSKDQIESILNELTGLKSMCQFEHAGQISMGVSLVNDLLGASESKDELKSPLGLVSELTENNIVYYYLLQEAKESISTASREGRMPLESRALRISSVQERIAQFNRYIQEIDKLQDQNYDESLEKLVYW